MFRIAILGRAQHHVHLPAVRARNDRAAAALPAAGLPRTQASKFRTAVMHWSEGSVQLPAAWLVQRPHIATRIQLHM